jgi:coatomer protein complex subunit alpha (xenin)
LWDVVRKQEIANRSIPHVRRSSLSPERDKVAFLSATSVTIATADLSQTSTHFDGARVKSGAWFKGQFFVYTTKTHLKYVLPNGDSGILRSIADRIYVAAVLEKQVICLNADSEVRRLEVDLTEARFKAALAAGKMGEVSEILRQAKLCSESIVDYLRKQNHPEVALLFVEDPELKFRLALSAADLETALAAAKQLDNPAVWEALADVATEQGRFGIAAEALRKSGNVQRLAFFYLLAGQIESLKKLKVDDALGLQRAMWLGDRPAIGKLLAGAAPKLAEVSLVENGSIAGLEREDDPVADWPLVNVSRPQFAVPSKSGEIEDLDEGKGWDLDLGDGINEEEEDQGWGIDIDITASVSEIEVGEVFVAPTKKNGAHERWATAEGAVAGELVAAGQFGGAICLLQEQIGLIDAEPLRKHFVEAFVASNATIGPLSVPLFGAAPIAGIVRERIKELMGEGWKKMRSEKTTPDAVPFFRSAIQAIPIVVCSTKAEEKELKADLAGCRNYLIGLTLEIEQRKTDDPKRKVELAAYFTHCQLQPLHAANALASAMMIAHKLKYLALAAEFANRALGLSRVPENIRIAANKIITLWKKTGETQKNPKLDYDPRNPFEVCAASLKPIYTGTRKIECPFCGAVYFPDYLDSKCRICEIAKVGVRSVGLTVVRPRRVEES